MPDAAEPDDAPRAIPADLVERILAALPDRGAGRVKEKKRSLVSQAKARLRVMAWTGLPPAQLAALRREDVDWDASTAGRKKGKGVPGSRRPVTSQGLEALRALDAAAAWGAFSESTVRRAWRRACAVVQKELAAAEKELGSHDVPVDLSALRPYDLRHTVATATLAATGSLTATQALLGHTDPRTTLRYARATVPAWLAEAAAKLDVYQQKQPVAAPRKPGRNGQNSCTEVA